MWKVNANEDGSTVQLESIHVFSPFGGVSITALEIDKIHEVRQDKDWVMVMGSEHGGMQLWTVNKSTGEPSLLMEIPSRYSHSKAVRRLRWRPSSKNSGSNEYEWISGSEDNTVRIHKISV